MSHALPLPRDPASPDVAYVLRCWGDFDIIDRATGNSLRPRGRKARALIAYLASNAGGTANRTQLADLLWSDRSENHARASLRQTLVELRTLSHGDGRLLTVDREHVQLDRSRLAIDIDELAEKLGAGDLDIAERVFANRGIRLFAGLDGADREFDAWLAIERARQRERFRVLTCEAVKSRLDKGDVKSARALIAHLQGQDPADEEAARLGLRADSLAGDHTTLRRRYKRLCDDLRQELGVEPSVETRALYQTLAADRAAQFGATSLEPSMPSSASAGSSAGQSIISARTRRWLWAALVAAALLVLLVAALIGLKRQSEAQPTAVAVLPFRDLSPHGGRHFAERLSEVLLSSLARTPGLKVMGRTSSWSLKDQQLDAPALGRKLGVAYLLEGSVLASGHRVRVNVSLVRTEDGAQLWSERYDGGLDDILTVQDEIAATIVARLRDKPVELTAVRSVTTRNHYVAVNDGSLVALALRDIGREADADRFLKKAEAAIRKSFRQGRVPNWFHFACAGVCAVRGERAPARSALERAVAQGWTNAEDCPAPIWVKFRPSGRCAATRDSSASVHALLRKQNASAANSSARPTISRKKRRFNTILTQR